MIDFILAPIESLSRRQQLMDRFLDRLCVFLFLPHPVLTCLAKPRQGKNVFVEGGQKRDESGPPVAAEEGGDEGEVVDGLDPLLVRFLR